MDYPDPLPTSDAPSGWLQGVTKLIKSLPRFHTCVDNPEKVWSVVFLSGEVRSKQISGQVGHVTVEDREKSMGREGLCASSL